MCQACGCGCHQHGEGQMPRRFLTKDEKIEKLNRYADDLRKELKAVETRITELQN